MTAGFQSAETWQSDQNVNLESSQKLFRDFWQIKEGPKLLWRGAAPLRDLKNDDFSQDYVSKAR